MLTQRLCVRWCVRLCQLCQKTPLIDGGTNHNVTDPLATPPALADLAASTSSFLISSASTAYSSTRAAFGLRVRAARAAAPRGAEALSDSFDWTASFTRLEAFLNIFEKSWPWCPFCSSRNVNHWSMVPAVTQSPRPALIF